jgi:hypothetical protein
MKPETALETPSECLESVVTSHLSLMRGSEQIPAERDRLKCHGLSRSPDSVWTHEFAGILVRVSMGDDENKVRAV